MGGIKMAWHRFAFFNVKFEVEIMLFKITLHLFSLFYNVFYNMVVQRWCLVMSEDIFDCYNYGGGVYWNLEGRDQECCYIFYNIQYIYPPQQSYLSQSHIKAEKPWPKLIILSPYS